MRHVIIGNSTAGIAAAETLRRADSGSGIILISEDEIPYSRSLTPYLISGYIEEDQLRFKPKTFFADVGIETKRGRVSAIDSRRAVVLLSDGEAVPFDRLLIATGASPLIPPIHGIDSRGVFCLRSAGDARAIAEAAKGRSRAVVIGGGLVGLLSAKALYELGLSVTVIEAMPHLLPMQLDAAAAQIVAGVFRDKGIDLMLDQQVREIATEAGQVVGALLLSGGRVDADIVIVGVGVRPNVSLAQASGIVTERGIIVDSRMQTSQAYIYAAGDVAEVTEFITGQRIVGGTWIAATEQGKAAAYNMAGIPREYEGALAVQNAADFFGLPVVSVGLVNAPDDTYETLILRQPAKRLYKKLVLRHDVVQGMVYVGDIARAGVITALIRNRARVTEFKDELLAGNLGRVSYASSVASPRQPDLNNYI